MTSDNSAQLKEIKNLLQAAYPDASIIVHDESASHAGHAGAAGAAALSHLRVIIVSESFKGKSIIQRHRAVNTLLQPFFDEGLHAAALELKTPE